MKKFLSAFLSLAMVFAILPTGLFSIKAKAATEYTSGNYTYTVSNSEATITDVDTSISGAVTIPSTLGGYPVTKIGDGAFYNRYEIEWITIPNSVTSIGDEAFYNCYGLIGITIPNRVTSIGNNAFGSCYGLQSLKISNGVTSIGNEAFSWCYNLTSITIPNSVTSIGTKAFYGCELLESIQVDVNNNIYSSKDGVLFDKAKAQIICYPEGKRTTSYNIPDSVTSIGINAFRTTPKTIYYSCAKDIKSISIGSGNTSLTKVQWIPKHSYNEVQITNPTCTEQGYTLYTCKDCSDTYKDNYTAIDPYAHNYIAEVTEPTCTQKGYTIYTCEYCGDSYKGDITPPDSNRHTFTETVTAPTCTAQGYTTYTCIECNISSRGNYTPIKHDYAETIIPPTETAEGFTLHICKNCGNSYSDNFVSNKLNVWGVKVIPSDVDVTLSWNAFDSAVEYYAKVYDKDFTKCLKTITTTETSAVFDYKLLSYNTNYKFIVTAKLSDGKYLTVANAIRVDGAMVIADRVVGLTLKLEGKGAIVDFLSVEKATEYLVNVFERDTTGRRIYTQTIDAGATSARVMTNLDAGGKYVVVINAKVDGSYMPLKDLRVNGIGVSFTAPVYNPSQVTIADQTATSIRFNWDAVRGASQYFIKVTEKETGKVVNTLNVVGKTTATLSRYTDGTRISPNTTYLLQFYTYINSITNAGEYGTPIEVTTKDFESVTIVARHNRNVNKINLSWNSTTNAVGYFVYTYKDGVKIANKYLDGADNTIYDLIAPSSSGVYTYGVIAYEKNSSGTAYTPLTVSNAVIIK